MIVNTGSGQAEGSSVAARFWDRFPRRKVLDGSHEAYRDVREFRREALAAIRKIKTVYPGLNLSTKMRGRLVLRPSRLAVAAAN